MEAWLEGLTISQLTWVSKYLLACLVVLDQDVTDQMQRSEIDSDGDSEPISSDETLQSWQYQAPGYRLCCCHVQTYSAVLAERWLCRTKNPKFQSPKPQTLRPYNLKPPIPYNPKALNHLKPENPTPQNP